MVWYSLVCALVIALVRGKQIPLELSFINDSPHSLQVYWIAPETGAGHIMSEQPLLAGSTFPMQSFSDHVFELRQAPSPSSGVCASPDQTCQTARITVADAKEQAYTISGDNLTVLAMNHLDNVDADAKTVIRDCQDSAKSQLHGTPETTLHAMDSFLKCVENGVTTELEKVNEEIAYQAKIRSNVAHQLENYTCADHDSPTTDDVDTQLWLSDKDNQTRVVHVKLDRRASRIHVVDNFISVDECRSMEEAAKATLHRATVADGKGGSELSDHRKAKQAGIQVHWTKEHEDLEEQSKEYHIATLSRRVYDYTERVLGMDIQHNGQEDLMSIQYEGRGMNSTEAPDRYTPHCDGECTGLPHKYGTRMATMVMYCTLPDIGGATNFRNSGVHVNGKPGTAVFFSYIDPETLVMDKGFTEHSGCPVMEGEKKIVTQWIRYGVDDDNRWNSFNTLGLKYSEEDNQ